MSKPAFQYISRGDTTEHNDCTVRALSAAAQVPYEQAHAALARAGRVNGRGVKFWAIQNAYSEFGGKWVAFNFEAKLPTLAHFTSALPSRRCVVLIRGHALALVDGVQLDLAPSGARFRVQGYWKFD